MQSQPPAAPSELKEGSRRWHGQAHFYTVYRELVLCCVVVLCTTLWFWCLAPASPWKGSTLANCLVEARGRVWDGSHSGARAPHAIIGPAAQCSRAVCEAVSVVGVALLWLKETNGRSSQLSLGLWPWS